MTRSSTSTRNKTKCHYKKRRRLFMAPRFKKKKGDGHILICRRLNHQYHISHKIVHKMFSLLDPKNLPEKCPKVEWCCRNWPVRKGVRGRSRSRSRRSWCKFVSTSNGAKTESPSILNTRKTEARGLVRSAWLKQNRRSPIILPGPHQQPLSSSTQHHSQA